MVRKQDFFGRTAILDVLQRRVLDLKEGYRQNVALLGTRDIGKTAILQHFLGNLEGEGVTAVYLDLEHGDFRTLLEKLTGSLLYNYSRSRGLALHEDIAILLESTKDSIPHTVQVIRKIYKDYHSRKLSTCFQGLLALPEIFTNESGRPCVLVLDEFQKLEDLPVTNVFQHLGKKIMTQKKCLYIVTSSYPQTAKKIFSEKLSLLFGNFEMIDVEPFDPQASRGFIEQSLQDIRMSTVLCDFLADFSGGYPPYLHLLCAELVRLSILHRQGEIFIPALAQAVENTLFDRWG
ncbi:MAG: ATP-binding protein [Candidatus Omnitrophica bacterium]|nr:ATP-binding protein [Candidatus Omnitrophota bacterium]